MDSSESDQRSCELSEYVLSASLPECVSITHGKHVSKSVQITKGDIVVLKSCDARLITLTYRDEESGRRKDIVVSINCPRKFVVLPPKESTASRISSVITYPSISDLVIDSPTYFEATSSFEDSNLNGTSINCGDRFRFRGVVTSPGDGEKRLKAIDKEDNVVFLSFDCKGNFYPLEDDQSYTLRDLVGFAPVPRRLKLVKDDFPKTAFSVDNQHSLDLYPYRANNPTEDVSDVRHDLPIPIITGVIHMLKPEMSVVASPLNDPDTVWTIPITADIHVRQYFLDDYEIPTKIIGKPLSPVPSHITEAEEIPNFPAPPTPPLTQPLIPIKINNFLDIYSNSLPVKAKVMDLSECNSYYKSMLSDCIDITIHRIEHTHRLYAEDLKTDAVYSLSKDAKVSFIEHPQKFNSISELVNVPIGTEIVILEDIASDFPKHFSLQFGDVICITSNIPVLMKVKHSDLECKIIKCERINKEKGSVTKLKLPLDFEVKMVISMDHNSQKIIAMHELINGKIAPTSENVAALLDEGENSPLKILPADLKNLQILHERLLITSLSHDSLNKVGQLKKKPHFVGISMNSGLVLAFRQRLELSEADRMVSERDIAQEQLEILTAGQYETRKQICKRWADEDEQENESVSSSDKCSTSGDSLQRTNSTGVLDTKKVKREKDKIRRLSRALNPKHWRASKAVPDPLPHPEAMGLMALAVRPHYEKPNDYQTKLCHPPPLPLLDQTFSSLGTSSGEEDERNIYEDVYVRPIRETQITKSKPFSGPLHKSLPSRRLFSHGRKAHGKASESPSHSKSNREEHLKTSDMYSVSSKSAETKDSQTKVSAYVDDDHVYEFPDGTLGKHFTSETAKANSHGHDTHQDNVRPKVPHIGPSRYVLPDAKPANVEKHRGRNENSENRCEHNETVAEIKNSENASPEIKPRTKTQHTIKTDTRENKDSHSVMVVMENASENVLPEAEPIAMEKYALSKDINESKDDQNMKAVIDQNHETVALSGKVSNSTEGKKCPVVEPPVPTRRTKKVQMSTQIAIVEEKHSSALYSQDTRNSCELPTVEDFNKENANKAEEREQVDYSDRGKNDISVKPPVPKPRGVKKRTQLKIAENCTEKDANVPVLKRDEETDFTHKAVLEGTEKLPVIQISAALLQKTQKGNSKPKPPPKPKLVPK